MADDVLEEKQIRNMKNRLKDYITQHISQKLLIQVCILCNIPVPKNISEKYK
jgi:hypothetical protein